MGSHSVTCHPTQVNGPRLNPSQAGWYSIYLPLRDGRLSWPSWLDSAPAGSRTSNLSITSPTPNHCITKTTINRYCNFVYQPFCGHEVANDGTDRSAPQSLYPHCQWTIIALLWLTHSLKVQQLVLLVECSVRKLENPAHDHREADPQYQSPLVSNTNHHRRSISTKTPVTLNYASDYQAQSFICFSRFSYFSSQNMEFLTSSHSAVSNTLFI